VPIAWETLAHGDRTGRAIYAEISAQKGFLFWIVSVVDKAFLSVLLSQWPLAGRTGRGARWGKKTTSNSIAMTEHTFSTMTNADTTNIIISDANLEGTETIGVAVENLETLEDTDACPDCYL